MIKILKKKKSKSNKSSLPYINNRLKVISSKIKSDLKLIQELKYNNYRWFLLHTV